MKHLVERIQKICQCLADFAVKQSVPAVGVECLPCDYKQSDEIPTAGWQPFATTDTWGGGVDKHCWFRFDVALPQNWQGGNVRLAVKTSSRGWDEFNPQFTCYVNGQMRQGLDMNHTTVAIDPTKDKSVALYAYTGYDHYVWLGSFEDRRFAMDAQFQLVDDNTLGLLFDMQVPLSTLAYTDEEHCNYALTVDVLNSAVNLLDLRQPHSDCYDRSVVAARQFLQQNYYQNAQLKTFNAVTCAGQTHIDTAWLWTIRQTREKVQRSFATALELMRRYPEYKFFASQPKQYQMLKQDCPQLYEQVKNRIAEGRWEADGAMWVEADCNLISGESFVRQILFGKRFFREEFGVDSKVLWLPDVFGYSASMPQILAQCGVDTFVTSKISWNDTNRMPWELFNWQGIDGTNVLSYFITSQEKTLGKTQNYSVYNGEATAPFAAGAHARFGQKHLTDDVLMLYGYGDGGGGPTWQFLENIRRMNSGVLGCPKATIGRVDDYFSRVHSKVDNDVRLPRWVGELYLEFHRGTYTSIAKNKRNNRKSEFACRFAELLGVVAHHLCGTAYPADKLNEVWETVLTNQFHDIIPGSSIEEVYNVTDVEYAQVLDTLSSLSAGAMQQIAQKVQTDGGYLVFNQNGARNVDVINDGGNYLSVGNVPAMGYAVLNPLNSGRLLRGDAHTLENDFFLLRFDEKMRICTLWDKRANRSVLPKGAVGNRLVAYEDLPLLHDAWEVRSYHKQKSWDIDDVSSVRFHNKGDRIEVVTERKFLDSTITQTVALYRDLQRIDFETTANWQTEHVVVKALFPVDVNANFATYDIPFGAVTRPTTSNTGWEQAKFEVCAHKFADVAEYGYGVALLNDCKYGHDVHDGVMALTLLKCSTYPNPNADKGNHVFTYSLMPHVGSYQQAGVVSEAYALNAPLTFAKVGKQQGSLPCCYAFAQSNTPSVVVETVKMAEDGSGYVVRCYEAFNQHVQATITLATTATTVFACDLLENATQTVATNTNVITHQFKPFEICTFIVKK